MKTQMTRRELLAAIGIATLVNCGRTERPGPERTQGPDSLLSKPIAGIPIP